MEQMDQPNQPNQMEQETESKPQYIPTDNEKHLYHVQLEKPLFDKRTGKRISVPSVQKFTEKEYNALVGKKSAKDKSNAEMLGYTTTILWNPKENK